MTGSTIMLFAPFFLGCVNEAAYPALRLAQLKVLRIPGKLKIEIIKTVAPRWNDVGILMDFDETGKKLEQIEKDKHDVEPCCQTMFQYWLEGNGIKPVSWKTLLQILEDCNFKTLADQVTDYFISTCDKNAML